MKSLLSIITNNLLNPFLEPISQRKSLSPIYIWVHIIENQNKF
jgi:hypothetical protein